MMTRQEITDEQWAVLASLFAVPKGRGRPPMDMRGTVEGIAWRFRTGAPWRDVPERFGHWNSIYQRFSTWSADGTWARVLATVQTSFGRGRSGRLDRLGGLHDHPGPPTRRDTQARHRGPD